MSAATSSLPLWGRKYKVEVSIPDASGGSGATVLTLASDAFEPEALRVTFDIYKAAFQSFWYADISIYNLDQTTTEKILSGNPTSTDDSIKQGMVVTVEAGYQAAAGNYGQIWKGKVLQPLWERENATDFKITLHCVMGLDELSRNSVGTVFSALTQQKDIVAGIAKNAFNPITLGTISSKLSTKELPRAKPVFGNPADMISDLAQDNNMMWYFGEDGLNIARPDDDVATGPQFVFAPPVHGNNTAGNATPAPDATQSIIGTPQQTQYGVSFRVLLDARLRVAQPLQTVKIDNSAIRLLKGSIGQLGSIGILDKDGVYIVVGLRFLGDTRGNEWYTDITGVTSVNGKLAMLNAVSAAAAERISLNGGTGG